MIRVALGIDTAEIIEKAAAEIDGSGKQEQGTGAPVPAVCAAQYNPIASATSSMKNEAGHEAELFEFYRRLLPRGRNAAKPMRVLAAERGISERALRREIQLLRRWGAPICSSRHVRSGGYYFPADDAEIQASIAALRNQAFSQLQTAAAQERVRQLDGQVRLSEGAEP